MLSLVHRMDYYQYTLICHAINSNRSWDPGPPLSHLCGGHVSVGRERARPLQDLLEVVPAAGPLGGGAGAVAGVGVNLHGGWELCQKRRVCGCRFGTESGQGLLVGGQKNLQVRGGSEFVSLSLKSDKSS